MKGYTKLERMYEAAADLGFSLEYLLAALQSYDLDLCSYREKLILDELSYLSLKHTKYPDGISVTSHGDPMPVLKLELVRRERKESSDRS